MGLAVIFLLGLYALIAYLPQQGMQMVLAGTWLIGVFWILVVIVQALWSLI